MMKSYNILSVLTFALIGISINAAAHDPKEHTKENQALDCSDMEDIKNMKNNDLVAMAMMKKCQKMMNGEMNMDGNMEVGGQTEDRNSIKDTSEQEHKDKH
ncbi:MAG: hypothetical protein CL578_18265 [Alteromonadaceae bacterium]|jgi:hypothetical protein|uniref:Pentapeptide MXKDX repeat protein n=2 Tax=Paraglaciecola TaxID=1621534 RepID=K6YJB9_9ALTE|nr:hypothetical protein [Alteromonadaceae bacterium]GAC03060.1 hypothetical protein GAGA_0195 [Paraglaciecola agarilytica NO2]GAC24096.1 hypothetical protein GMES_1800 [Paraglaciecola mesophila KMM 241]|tara:strand:- start:837 stop:1139 length:303 start_codon:yes stop_codon:yes gene_type:complete